MNLRKVTAEDGTCTGYRAWELRSRVVNLGIMQFPKPLRNDGIVVLAPEIEAWRDRNGFSFEVDANPRSFTVEFRFPDWHTAFAFKVAWT